MKQSRQEKIVELVETSEIETQEELAEKLKEAGFAVTQSTISREHQTASPVQGARGKRTAEICGVKTG